MSALQLGRSQEQSELAGARIRFRVRDVIFESKTLEREDSRRDYGERRVIALGVAEGVALTVVHTDRAETGGGEINRRIISARKSNRREREAYKKATTPQ